MRQRRVCASVVAAVFFFPRRGLVPPRPLLLVVLYRSEAESMEKLRLWEEKSVDDLALPAGPSSSPSPSLLNGAASLSVSVSVAAADDDDD